MRVIDGPFAEAKELIAGFAILEVDSLAEAVEHARKFALLVGTERVDVRRVVEFEDLQRQYAPDSTATAMTDHDETPTRTPDDALDRGWRRCGGSSRRG